MAQKEGYDLEESIHNRILQYKDIKCLREKDIMQTYGKNISGIDHLFKYKDIAICLQVKWQKKRPPIKDVNHFIKCIYDIKKYENCEIIGIFVSKMKPSEPSIISLNNDKIISIYSNKSQNDLVDKVENEVVKIFNIQKILNLNNSQNTYEIEIDFNKKQIQESLEIQKIEEFISNGIEEIKKQLHYISFNLNGVIKDRIDIEKNKLNQKSIYDLDYNSIYVMLKKISNNYMLWNSITMCSVDFIVRQLNIIGHKIVELKKYLTEPKKLKIINKWKYPNDLIYENNLYSLSKFGYNSEHSQYGLSNMKKIWNMNPEQRLDLAIKLTKERDDRIKFFL